MFGRLSDPQKPEATLLRCGIAFWALAGLLQFLYPPISPGFPALLGTLCLIGWVIKLWQRRNSERYDLRRLWDAPPPEPEEPFEDTVPTDEEAAPYCGWCDEAYAPGTYRCARCGRPLA
jgi:hypothetical protein